MKKAPGEKNPREPNFCGEERNVREQPERMRRVVYDSLYLWSNMWSKNFGDFVSGGCGGSKPLLGLKIEKIRENRTIFTDFWSPKLIQTRTLLQIGEQNGL